MTESLLAFMEDHDFETVDDFKGHSLQYFTTHSELVRIQSEARAASRAAHETQQTAAAAHAATKKPEKMITGDAEWSGDDFVEQTDALSRG